MDTLKRSWDLLELLRENCGMPQKCWISALCVPYAQLFGVIEKPEKHMGSSGEKTTKPPALMDLRV